MTSEPLIELGEDWTLSEELSRNRRGMTGPGRVAVGCALAVVSLGFLGASSVPPKPAISLVAIVPRPTQMAHGQDIRLFGDVLVANWSGAITAYGLDGEKRWEHRRNGRLTMMSVYQSGTSPPLILVIGAVPTPREGTQELDLTSHRTVALDPLTGEEVWSMDAFLSQVGEMLISRDNDGDLRVYSGDPPKLRWHTGARRAANVDSVRGTVVALTYEGVFQEFDLATGRLLWQHPMSAPPGDAPAALWSVGDRIFLSTDGVGNIMAYDRQTLSRVEWDGSWSATFECDSVICARSLMSPSSTLVIDPATGAVLWRSSEPWLVETEAGILAIGAAFGPSVPAAALLDPLAGSVRKSLDGWRTTGPRPGEIKILVKPQHGRTEVGVLEAGGLRIIGAVPYRVNDCNRWDGALICDLDSGDLGVWRLNL